MLPQGISVNGSQVVVIYVEPNDWVSEDLLMAVTGLKSGTIARARKNAWLLGREYKHMSPEGDPKPTSECVYNRKAVDAWIASQKQPIG
ncbi:excisionase [Kosakonia cowanii]|nr:excisionase [Kosakonia cowanii]